MTYMLRDRPDGQVEIILTKPILVGVFPERNVAQRVCSFLQDGEIDWSVEEPEGVAGGDAAEDIVIETEELVDPGEIRLRELVERSRNVPAPAPRVGAPRPVRNLPAVVQEKPVAPAFLTDRPVTLTDEQQEVAFRRIGEGEKVSVVAAEMGVGMPQLRGLWANHKRRVQKHLAEGGQIACAMCKKLFTPSLSNPDTCARCSHE